MIILAMPYAIDADNFIWRVFAITIALSKSKLIWSALYKFIAENDMRVSLIKACLFWAEKTWLIGTSA